MAKLFKGAEYLISEATKDDVFTPEDFTEEQRQIAETAEQFAETEALPAEHALEQHEPGVAAALMRKAGDAGLLMIDAPEAYGGLALDKATSMLAAERMGMGGAFSVSYAAHTGIGTLPLVYYGTDAQKDRYLTKLVTGEWAAAYCLTEPEAGSDAMGGKATATLSPDGKHYLLDGTKQFITNGSFANLFTVFAKVDRKHFTAFLVERTFPGVTVGPEEKKLGIKGSSTTSVIFESAKVPVENVLGEIGKGHKIAFNVLNVGRFKLGAAVTGAAKLALATGAAYANARKQFGTPIARFGAIREKLADQAAGVYASESLIYRLAGLIDDRLATIPAEQPGYYEAYQQGIEEYAIECAIAKVFCSEVLADVVDEVVQIHGGYGFIQEYPAEKYYRDERINRIFEGTNEINRLLVPGTILRRALKGELPLQREVMKAMDALMNPSLDEVDPAVPFAAEKATVANLKRAFLVVAGAAVQRYGEALKDEQEVLLALADVAIQAFAAESVVLRAEKTASTQPEARRALAAAAVKVHTFAAAEKAATAARRAAFYVGEGDTLTILLGGIRRFSKYDAAGLLQAKRRLADAVLETEKYPF
ncbi:acyl-CoA dehydrogenase family protein [Anaeromyxobacter dehalogenans]|uniref:Butyryl-CoA dehydrogenase n=1 Tax=Anaeromyxobacter dehalogenans (strain 2CP-C) TaxID=290397 RepID=Q2IMV1_ANADE|nr:acyl-CoA dehydrogenase family protein [Anaeromyxobacter dehalogenans]ABC80136.1 Butyryl-CoA dehydrogenase [Anaeromyxobacter dehalogenans 2CP-C]